MIKTLLITLVGLSIPSLVRGNSMPIQFHDTTQKVKTKQTAVTSDTIAAQFPGGEDSLTEFLIRNITYEGCYVGKIKSSCTVHFTVLEDGSITNIFIQQYSTISDFNHESIRVVRRMPKYIPATVNGKAIPYVIQLTIIFEIEE